MQPRSTLAPITLSLALAACTLTACGGAGDTKKTEAKKTETKAADAPVVAPVEDTRRDPGTSLDKAATTIDTTGPVPPEASAVFYTVDGALIPLGELVQQARHDRRRRRRERGDSHAAGAEASEIGKVPCRGIECRASN